MLNRPSIAKLSETPVSLLSANSDRIWLAVLDQLPIHFKVKEKPKR